MLQTNKIPSVSECAIAECAYNSNASCHAIAITIGDGDHPMCDTFFKSQKHISIQETAGVGACKVSACRHNSDFECGATSIRIGQDGQQGKCMTFAVA
ncbi:MAG: DUF1540 domain-containing protein [Gallionellaceae bacterium]